MDDKQRKQLMETLKNAIDVETETATQDHMLQECIRIWEEKKPTLRLGKLDEIPIPIAKTKMDFVGMLMLWGTVGLLGLIMMISFLVLSGPGYSGGVIKWIFFLIGAGCFIFCGVTTHNGNKSLAEDAKKSEDLAKQKKESNEKIKKDNEIKRAAYYKNLQEWQKSYNEVTSKICSLKADTEKTLDRVYQTDLIYPKYRNLPALTCIYEYFVTGRCDELTGPHGAYNMYEDETRKDTIISQVNVVIDNLEQIKNSQYMLYQQVSAIRQDTYAVTRELQAIKGYTLVTAQMSALNAYYSAVTASNTRISATCDLLE